MRGSKKESSGKTDTTEKTTSPSDSAHENSSFAQNANCNECIRRNLANEEYDANPTIRSNRERLDEEAFDCRPAGPPKRVISSSEQHQIVASSHTRENTTHNIDNSPIRGACRGAPIEKGKDSSISKAKKISIDGVKNGEKSANASKSSSDRVIKQKQDNNVSSASRRKTNSLPKDLGTENLKAKNSVDTDAPPRDNSFAEGGIEKTRVTTRPADSSYAGGKSHDRNNANTGDGNSNEIKNDCGDDEDISLSTAPAPPSLRVRGHYSLQPGAYRMTTDGVARYVNAASDDIDAYSNHFENNSGFDDAIHTVEASLVEDEPFPSPPPYRPTTSEGRSYSGQRRYEYHGVRNHSRIQENTERYRDEHTSSSTNRIRGTHSTSLPRVTVGNSSSSVKDSTDEISKLKKKRMVMIACVVGLFVVVLASILIAYAIQNSQNSETHDVNNQQSPSPPPTRPSSPSEIALETFIKTLPDFTKESLQTENSPQSKAIDWMLKYDDIESYALPRQLQRFALISLYFSITSKAPSHEALMWFAGLHECIWYDSTCVDNVYIELSLHSNHTLRGTIVPELALLSSLERLRIDENALVGVLPTELGQMTNLREIRINDNLFRGKIPTEFGKLSNLEDVNLGNNLLSGRIPTEIGSWSKVQNFVLANNTLVGFIPSEIGQMSQLVSFSVSSNKLEGKLPSEVGRLKKIKSFSAEKNYLSGEFISKFENLRQTLQYLQLRSNELSGTLSSSIGLLTHLIELDVSENRLKGALPTEVGLMTSLIRLQMYSNAFSDTIPTELGMLLNAKSIALYDNKFVGTVSDEVCELIFNHQLQRISVDCNYVSCLCCICGSKNNI